MCKVLEGADWLRAPSNSLISSRSSDEVGFEEDVGVRFEVSQSRALGEVGVPLGLESSERLFGGLG